MNSTNSPENAPRRCPIPTPSQAADRDRLVPADFEQAYTRMAADLMLTQLKRSLHDPTLGAQDVLALTERILALQIGR